MGKHFHDPFRPHAARPVDDDDVPVVRPEPVHAPVADPAPEPETQAPPAEPEVVELPDQEESEAEVVEDEVAPPIDPPPQVGPGSSADAWRAYAAEVTRTPPQTWAEESRADIIKTLREQGIAVDQSGIQGS